MQQTEVLKNRPRRNVRLLKNVAPIHPAYTLLRQIRGRNFLTGAELNREELSALIDVAHDLKQERLAGKNQKLLEGMHVALLFEKSSLRTRFSFTVAMNELGGQVIDCMSSQRKQEEPEDLVRVLGGYCQAIMLRTHDHVTLERMASKTRVPIVNGLSDLHHPCQTIADLLTLKESFRRLEGLTLTYVGDGNNVLHSLLLLAPTLGVNVHFACPRGYGPSIDVLEAANTNAVRNGSVIRAFADPAEASVGAHALYTDVWTSMGFEAESEARERAFADYQLNADLYARAAPDAIIMHCLPMLRGKEISSEMADHPRSALFAQSENRLHAQKALLVGLLGK